MPQSHPTVLAFPEQPSKHSETRPPTHSSSSHSELAPNHAERRAFLLSPGPIIGRERELATVVEMLRRPDVRLLTLFGPPGIGKTRLSMQVAADVLDHFAGGVHFIELATITDPDQVMPTIARTLGVREVPAPPLLSTLKEEIADNKMLVVLDNFEQVLPAGKKIEELLAACSNLKVLATSRSPLRLRTERPFVVEPLALPEADRALSPNSLSQYASVALFVERAGLAEPGFELTPHNADTVAAICRRVDGLPLAIELVAARVRLIPPESIVTRLARPLRLLTGGAPDAPRRQQTMRAAIEWSYALLSEREQRLFRELAVFVGGCSLQAAEAVCNEAGDISIDSTHAQAIEVLDGVQSLVDKSLVRKIPQEGGDPRLGMLETVREYASEQLVARGEAEVLQRRHAQYFLVLAAAARPDLEGPEMALSLTQLDLDYANLRAALTWLLEQEDAKAAEGALQMLITLRNFWNWRVRPSEVEEWLEKGLAHIGPEPTPIRVNAQMRLSTVARQRGAYPNARARAEQAVTAAMDLGDKRLISYALNVLATAEISSGDYATARARLEESLVLTRELGNDVLASSLLNNLGEVARFQGDYISANAFYKESSDIFRRLGSVSGVMVSTVNLGHAARHLGNLKEAKTYYLETLALSQDLHNYVNAVEALMGLSSLALADALSATDQSAIQQVEGLEQTARLCGLASALLESGGRHIAPVDQAQFEHNVAAVRERLDEQAFTLAWEEGRSRTLDQALELATGSDQPDDAAAGHREPDHRHQTYPDALTEREVDVLRLIAAGQSNQEIAAALVLSLRTVERHISNIYQKIGATGRIARATATAYALKNGLTG